MCTRILLMAGACFAAHAQPPGPDGTPASTTAPTFPDDPSPEEGDLRLLRRRDVNGFATGALQSFRGGRFGSVCAFGFGLEEAQVACRQLGFSGGVPLRDALLEPSNLLEYEYYYISDYEQQLLEDVRIPFALVDLDCTGDEARLADCRSGQDSGGTRGGDLSCADAADLQLSFSFAYVACGTIEEAEQGDLRLVGPGSETSPEGGAYGALEVFTNGGWGGVCNVKLSPPPPPGSRARRFTVVGLDYSKEATVACRQLGFADGRPITPLEDATSDSSRIPAGFAGARCSGDEARLEDCSEASFSDLTDTCFQQERVSVQCYRADAPERNGATRLADGEAGAGFEYGRIEVLLNGTWSKVSQEFEHISHDDAQVACRAVGFSGGGRLRLRAFDEQVPQGLFDLGCKGSEASLLDCPGTRNPTPFAEPVVFNLPTTFPAAAVACANSTGTTACTEQATPEEGAVRLTNGFGTPCDPVHSGEVEVFHRGNWAAFCRQARDPLPASVVCRQLGFAYGNVVAPGSSQRRAGLRNVDHSFWLEDAACKGTEAALEDCDLKFQTNPDQDEVVEPPRPPPNPRRPPPLPPPLPRGELPRFPTAPVECSRQDPRFEVTCRQFPVKPLLEAVVTPGAAEGDVRLLNETRRGSWALGRLEVFADGSWRQVCGRGFGGRDADVACRQLGFGAGTVSNGVDGVRSTGSRSAPPVGAALLACSGTEASLLECAERDRTLSGGDLGCLQDSRGLYIGCVAEAVEGTEGDVRLVRGKQNDTAASGFLEIFHAGAWGTLCQVLELVNPDLDPLPDRNTPDRQALANVACRQLGYERGAFQFQFDQFPTVILLTDPVALPAWVNSPRCTGDEAEVAACGTLTYGDTWTQRPKACWPSQLLQCTSATAR